MKVIELIEKLRDFPGDAQVTMYDYMNSGTIEKIEYDMEDGVILVGNQEISV